jgi:PPOX class probable F420-dependent enzyme
VGTTPIMPKPPLPAKLEAFLAQPNPSVIATLRPDGSPHSTATWYLWEHGRVLVNMDEGRKRLEHLRRDPRVSITVLGDGDWYHHVTLTGRVAELDEDTDLDDIDRLCRHYMGQPYSQRDRRRFSARIEVEAWHSWAVYRPWATAA